MVKTRKYSGRNKKYRITRKRGGIKFSDYLPSFLKRKKNADVQPEPEKVQEEITTQSQEEEEQPKSQEEEEQTKSQEEEQTEYINKLVSSIEKNKNDVDERLEQRNREIPKYTPEQIQEYLQDFYKCYSSYIYSKECRELARFTSRFELVTDNNLENKELVKFKMLKGIFQFLSDPKNRKTKYRKIPLGVRDYKTIIKYVADNITIIVGVSNDQRINKTYLQEVYDKKDSKDRIKLLKKPLVISSYKYMTDEDEFYYTITILQILSMYNDETDICDINKYEQILVKIFGRELYNYYYNQQTDNKYITNVMTDKGISLKYINVISEEYNVLTEKRRTGAKAKYLSKEEIANFLNEFEAQQKKNYNKNKERCQNDCLCIYNYLYFRFDIQKKYKPNVLTEQNYDLDLVLPKDYAGDGDLPEDYTENGVLIQKTYNPDFLKNNNNTTMGGSRHRKKRKGRKTRRIRRN